MQKLSKQAMEDFKKFSSLSEEIILARMGRFASICKRLDKLNEVECNEGRSDSRDAEEHKLLGEAINLAKVLGCKLHHQGDPRGPAIRLIRPDGRSNGADGDTWYV